MQNICYSCMYSFINSRIVQEVNMKKSLLALYLFVAICMVANGVRAATQSVTANISFDTALTLTKNADINFGTVEALTAETYTITSAGVVTAAGVGEILYGTKNAASITIEGSTTQTINISVGNYAANNGVTPSNATCNYNAAGAGTCALNAVAAPAAGKILLIGVDAAVGGAQAAGTSAAPTFDITVVYS